MQNWTLIPHSPQKKALQISVAPFLIFVSQKISQKCIKYCESTARNSKGLHHALIIKSDIIFRSEGVSLLAGVFIRLPAIYSLRLLRSRCECVGRVRDGDGV